MKLPVVVASVLLLAYGVSAGDSPPEGPRPLGEGVPGDGDPRINPDEIVAPSVDADDPAWVPIYKEAENPATIQCGGRTACEDYKQAEAQEASRTATTEAPR